MGTNAPEVPSEEYIITVMAKDRPGIIAAITRTLFEMGGNVTELSQTVMRGYFTIILSASLPPGWEPEEIKKRIEAAEPEMELSAYVRRYDPVPLFVPKETDQGAYILTVQGKDRPGIIAQVSTYLASQGINIEDFYAQAVGDRFTMVLQIRPEDPWTADHLRLDLEAICSELGINAYLLHQDIFHATSEVGAIRRLVRRPSRGD
ncbi:MAG: amino acid-binding protein [Candidatus Poribacteria bacterium]|nr:MAG: amino acid-binding protein [Candidatus Poribacteria bacterium]